MIAGTPSSQISTQILLDDYYANLHGAYNAMRSAFHLSRLTQENIAEALNIDKALVSKRLRGLENLTIKTMSFMGTALGCRVDISFVPYETVGSANYYVGTNSAEITGMSSKIAFPPQKPVVIDQAVSG